MSAPDVRPVGDLPDELGRTAPRELQSAGIDSLVKVSRYTEQELLAIHGVGPKAIRILAAALAEKDLGFRRSEQGPARTPVRPPRGGTPSPAPGAGAHPGDRSP